MKYKIFRWLLPKFCAMFGADVAPVTPYPLQDHTDVGYPLTPRHKRNRINFEQWRKKYPRPPYPDWKPEL